MTTKETFFKEKLNNFSDFVKNEIGEDNDIYTDIQKYKSDLNVFMNDLISIVKLSGNSIITTENINKYLSLKKVDKEISEKAIDKLHRYLNMFIDIMNY